MTDVAFPDKLSDTGEVVIFRMSIGETVGLANGSDSASPKVELDVGRTGAVELAVAEEGVV